MARGKETEGGTVIRTHHYVVAQGVEMSSDGSMIEQEHVIDGSNTDIEFLKRKVRKNFPNFLPQRFVWHKQQASMSKADFYGNAKFGKDIEYATKSALDDGTNEDNIEE